MKHFLTFSILFLAIFATSLQAQSSGASDGFIFVKQTDYTNLVESMRKHVETAKEQGLAPFIYYSATWCQPCQAIKKYHNDPAMQAAYQGAYIVEVDADLIYKMLDEELLPEEFHVGSFPTWINLEETGIPGYHLVDGGEWGENIPANMAPVLQSYFSFRGDYMDWYPPGE